jgi:hypothetical protein
VAHAAASKGRPRASPRGGLMLQAAAMVLLAPVFASACRDAAPTRTHKPDIETSAPCHPGRGEKLGLPYARVCPVNPAGTAEPAFWIQSVPLPCLSGPHDEVECRPVSALGATAGGDTRTPASLAALVDASSAHRLCTMRLGGRLPTRTERAQARALLGLATLSVVESAGTTHFEFREVPEWVTEKGCDQPSILEAECGAGVAPATLSTRSDRARVRSCDLELEREPERLPAVALGEYCPAAAFRWETASTLLPCSVRPPLGGLGPVTAPRTFRITCQAPRAEVAVHPEAEAVELAAVRCIVPESLLDGAE